jgi:hypothetical protein
MRVTIGGSPPKHCAVYTKTWVMPSNCCLNLNNVRRFAQKHLFLENKTQKRNSLRKQWRSLNSWKVYVFRRKLTVVRRFPTFFGGSKNLCFPAVFAKSYGFAEFVKSLRFSTKINGRSTFFDAFRRISKFAVSNIFLQKVTDSQKFSLFGQN